MQGMMIPPGMAGPVWAVVPMKQFVHAKGRLAVVLDTQERERLARAMLLDTLDALVGAPSLAGVFIVTSEPSLLSIEMDRVKVLYDQEESGINAAIRQAMPYLKGKRLLIIPADVPFVQSQDIEKVIAESESHPVVVVSDRHASGTNLLGICYHGAIEVSFGHESFRRHLHHARGASLGHKIVDLPRLAWDIDNPEDLEVPPYIADCDRVVRTIDVLEALLSKASG